MWREWSGGRVPGKIFINYRRDDSASQALNVAQYLESTFGKSSVFIDVDRLKAGQKFPVVLEDKLSQCKVMVAVIGPSWLGARDEATGARRLDNPEDWVRLEIERALARGVHVIPVLVAGASLPKKADLPPSLQPLVEHQYATVTTNGFRNEMAGLARDIAELLGPRRRWFYAAGAAALLLAGAIALPLIGVPVPWTGSPWTGSDPARQTPPAVDREESDRKAAAAKKQADEEAEAAARKAAAVPKPGETFRDCADCPEMVVVPAGSFTMGSPESEAGRSTDEGPQRQVTIRQPIAVGKYEVTFDEWDACVAAGGCKQNPGDEGWGRGRRPVINVSWHDAKAYVAWLSKRTGKSYRLLTEAEWEYSARAGTTTRYAFGNTITKSQAQFSEGTLGSAGKTVEAGSFKPNAFGLHDMHGNVWEWTEDHWHENYEGAPLDGTAWTKDGDASRLVLRGGSWVITPRDLRSATRFRNTTDYRINLFGFRVGRTLTP